MTWFVVNYVLALFVGFVIYNLALTITGSFISYNKSIIPVFIFSIIIFISKYMLHASALIHTLLVLMLCILLVYIFNSIDLILVMVGALITMILAIFGSILVVCPVLKRIGVAIAINMRSLDWLYLSLGETMIPLITLFILRAKKISIKNYINECIK